MLFTSFVRTLEPSIPTNYALITADTACRVPTTYSLFLLPYTLFPNLRYHIEHFVVKRVIIFWKISRLD